jgi:hypothetical protein
MEFVFGSDVFPPFPSLNKKKQSLFLTVILKVHQMVHNKSPSLPLFK